MVIVYTVTLTYYTSTYSHTLYAHFLHNTILTVYFFTLYMYIYTYAAFHFFADVALQRYYKRFVRDYIRYKDEIFCIADDIITAIRNDVRKTVKGHNSDAVFGSGNYYALHIR